jgi:C_GCAxxG_C_C family probable redox protein
MGEKDLIRRRVHEYYWDHNLNCAKTTLKILAEILDEDVQDQVLQAASGMDGAGRYRAQCGLVEGTLMFIGLLGGRRNQTDEEVERHCYGFARSFEAEFGDLRCAVLRPQGFKPDNPPHLCEDLSRRTILFSLRYVKDLFNTDPTL